MNEIPHVGFFATDKQLHVVVKQGMHAFLHPCLSIGINVTLSGDV